MKVSPPSLRRLSNVLGVSVAFLGCFEKMPESTLGEHIIKARLYYGYTKREFAALLRISERTLYEWEYDRKILPEEPRVIIERYLDILSRDFLEYPYKRGIFISNFQPE
ncbi:DNA-binding protein [Brevibacillus formosus]|uniref:DNA-binding protein n=1 Tax=Brevibacillus formosus TaxID=54913 RepID=A0A837KVN9_9BACL|nr:DNA-binding protein [Brevibacillus formosus]PSK00678.1 XRE family transcriptional regulator [Brevibacillus formosus]